MKPLGIISVTALGAGLLAFVGLLAARHATAFWTDARDIHQPPDAPVRSILWQPARPIAGVNTSVDEYEAKYSPDGAVMVFVRRKPGQNADLFMSRWSPSGWSTPEAIANINSDAEELGPEISSDGQSLYFYSDRAGGRGGYDLWVSRRSGDAWATPQNLGEGINTEFNEYGPAISPDRRTLYFSSNRPRAGEEIPAASPWGATMRERHARHDYDLYQADLRDGVADRARTVDWANTARDEGAPAVSPAGDFLYFSSDRDGGAGGYDLYRARLNDPRRHDVENLGQAVNSRANELDPGLSADGFRLTFSSDRALEPSEEVSAAGDSIAHRSPGPPQGPERGTVEATGDAPSSGVPPTPPDGFLLAKQDPPDSARVDRDYNLWSTASREVFLDHRPLGAQIAEWLNSAWPWILLLALLALLFWLLAMVMRSAAWRRRFARLSLLARCLLVSLLIHAVIASLMAIWRVGASLGELMQSGGTRVVLASSTTDMPGDVTSQFATTIESPDTPRLQASETLLPRFELSPPAADVSLERRRHADSPLEVPSSTPSPSAHEPVSTDSSPPRLGDAAIVRDSLPTAAPPENSVPETSRTEPAIAPVAAPLRPSPLPAAAQPPKLAAREVSPDNEPATPTLLLAEPIRPGAVPEPQFAEASASDHRAALPPRTPSLDAPLPAAERPNAVRPMPAEPSASLAPTLGLPRQIPSLAAESIPAPPVERAPATITPREASDAPAMSLPPPPISPLPRADASPTPDLPRALRMSSRDPLPALPPELPQPVEDFAQRAPEQRSELVERMGGSRETERAVALALEWLKRAQEPDGSWSSKRHGGEVNCDTAMTGMALLCFLSAGHTHTQDGPYRETVSRAIDRLTSRQLPDGNLAPDETMYGQTIASVALCEAYAMTHDAKLARPVKLAVEFVDASARSNDGSAGRTSVLGWQVMAMESARRAGVKTSNITFDAARRWLDSVSTARSPGRYAYQRGQAANQAMTAEAMFVQQLLGHTADEPRMEESARFILEARPRWQDAAPTHYWYYATLAMFQHQGAAWKEWNEAIAPELVSHQRTEGELAGSWDPQDRWSKMCGRVHQTAVCTLSLEVYYRYKARAE